jgi:hypothetical protein
MSHIFDRPPLSRRLSAVAGFTCNFENHDTNAGEQAVGLST